jgi:hypothetical protein
MADDVIPFNGVDVDNGRYLFPPMALDRLASIARTDPMSGPHIEALGHRHADDEDHLDVMWGIDRERLDSAGWALITPAAGDAAALEALQPLRTRRLAQAGDRYRELVVHPGEDADAFLARHDMGPDAADPRKLPYYLLLVGSPEDIPFELQYQLDVTYAVGRLHFDTQAEYAAYARTVDAAERAAAATTPPGVRLFGTRNPGDTATALSASRLVEPLAEDIVELSTAGTANPDARVRVGLDVGDTAKRDRLLELLFSAAAPAVLFTATHGLGTSGAAQREVQGALLCQEWPGPFRPGKIDERQYLAGSHIPNDRAVVPRVVFSFSCYGAGTPRHSDLGCGQQLADRSFLGRLPQRLLGNPAGGALAFVGHVDRAFSCSFLWNDIDPQITSMASTMLALVDGARVGSAMEYLNSRYAAITTRLAARLAQDKAPVGLALDDVTLSALWTASHDARNYVVLGDPAVRAILG